jgi:hypothetical protein
MRAGDGIRTHDNNVGNVVLYQLSYARDFRPATLTSYGPIFNLPLLFSILIFWEFQL